MPRRSATCSNGAACWSFRGSASPTRSRSRSPARSATPPGNARRRGVHDLAGSRNSEREYLKGSFYWHFDGVIQVPILASLLSAKVLPPSGGNTEFCNTYAAYDELPEEEQGAACGPARDAFELGSLLYHDPEPSQEMTKQMPASAKWNCRWSGPIARAASRWCWAAPRTGGGHGPQGEHAAADAPARMGDAAAVLLQPQVVGGRHGDVGQHRHAASRHALSLDSGREMHRTKLEGEEPIE